MLCFRAKGKKLVETHSSLPRLRPGWALVRVRMAGICNTDLEILRGYHNFRGTPGHEFVGEVQEVSGVSAAGGEGGVGERGNWGNKKPWHPLGLRPGGRVF